MKTLMHTNTSSKTTHNIKISLIKQCYNAMHASMCWWYCLNVLLILPQCADTASMCWYCYSADTVTLICMLYTTCSMFRAWPVYIALLCHAEIMQLLNHALLKLNKSSILSIISKTFKTQFLYQIYAVSTWHVLKQFA
jgi:hypothetical protein